jgi:hypothetical protein
VIRRWVVAAAAALLTAWVLAPSAVPIYDGIGNPDEPYRWVHPPAHARHTSPPTTATKTLRASGGRNVDDAYVNTGEFGPQISVYIPVRALDTPDNATDVEVTVTPVRSAVPPPPDGTLASNVYRIAATTAAGPASLDDSGDAQRPAFRMRAPDGKQPGPVAEHFDGTTWSRVGTSRVGFDVYQASLTALGDWALVRLDPARAAPQAADTSSAGSTDPLLIAVGAAAVLLAAAVVAIRVARARRTR